MTQVMMMMLRLLRRCEVCYWRRRRARTRSGMQVCLRCGWLAAVVATLSDQQLQEWKKILEGP